MDSEKNKVNENLNDTSDKHEVNQKENKINSKSKKKALSKLKKEMKLRIKEIEAGDDNLPEGRISKRNRKSWNIVTLILSIIISMGLVFLPSYYDNRLISSRINLPFIWDYSDGLSQFEIQIFAALAITIFLIIKLSQKRIRDKIKAVFNYLKILVITLSSSILICLILSFLSGRNYTFINLETPFIWTFKHGFNELGIQIFLVILSIIFILIQLSQEQNRIKIKVFIQYLVAKFWILLNWILELLTLIYHKTYPILKKIQKILQVWTNNLPGVSQKSIGWIQEKSKRFSKLIIVYSQNIRKYAKRQMILFGNGINISRKNNSDIEIKYKKSELIGVGGMANVYNSNEVISGSRVVWKEAASSRINSLPEVNRRLLDESEILSNLDHPRIPKHIDSGEIQNDNGENVVVMIMEFIEGRSLKDDIDTFLKMNRTFTIQEAITTMSQICNPLEYMADLEVPVYHRDIKPANIIIEPGKGAIIIDFGLAKGVDAGSDVSLSQGMSEGWSPPERRDGISGGFTDVYSLGQTLWRMLTGERPFHALTLDEIMEKLVSKNHPEWVAEVILASAQRYDRRIQSVFEFRLMLENEGKIPN